MPSRRSFRHVCCRPGAGVFLAAVATTFVIAGSAPPADPTPARVDVKWSGSPAGILATEPSLQVVAHGLLMRDSPLHDKLFGLLRDLGDLGASRVRYVPWLPTPQLGVAELEPPNSTHTSWNFTLLDQQFLDVWDAVQGGAGLNLGERMIPNFSTPPTWLYSDDWSYVRDCSQANGCKSSRYEKGTAPASKRGGLRALGDYYGRLLAWYTRGGFIDELGKRHESGHHLNITVWEIFNEPDYEHGHTVETYTQEFDAIVAGIRRHADPERRIKFVAMNNPNIDDRDKVVAWAEYFFNATNHAPGVRDAIGEGNFVGYHAYPTDQSGGADIGDEFFSYVDDFVDSKVSAVLDVVERMSPGVTTMLDECGTTGPIANPFYWVASASYWAYFWMRVSVKYGSKVAVVGQSQYIDSPDREPGVTMMDWKSGNGTQKYWVTRMMIEETDAGDTLHTTTVDPTSHIFAQATSGTDADGKIRRRIILINKQGSNATVLIDGATSARVVDQATGNGPPRVEAISGGQLVLPPFATAAVAVSTGAGGAHRD